MLNTVQLQIFRAFYILLIFFIISIFDFFHLSCQGGLILKKSNFVTTEKTYKHNNNCWLNKNTKQFKKSCWKKNPRASGFEPLAITYSNL